MVFSETATIYLDSMTIDSNSKTESTSSCNNEVENVSYFDPRYYYSPNYRTIYALDLTKILLNKNIIDVKVRIWTKNLATDAKEYNADGDVSCYTSRYGINSPYCTKCMDALTAYSYCKIDTYYLFFSDVQADENEYNNYEISAHFGPKGLSEIHQMATNGTSMNKYAYFICEIKPKNGSSDKSSFGTFYGAKAPESFKPRLEVTFASNECTEGGCCNTSTGRFLPSTTVCNSQINEEKYCRVETGVTEGIYRRISQQYCSGHSQSCNGATQWTYLGLLDNCNGFGCNPTTNTCNKCNSDKDCALSDKCTNKLCIPVACNAFETVSNHSCILLEGKCFNKDQCEDSQICVSNTCASLNCPWYMQTGNHECILKPGYCSVSSDCNNVMQDCINNVCMLEEGLCYTHSDCPDSEYCSDFYCNPLECSSGQISYNHMCVNPMDICTDDSDCSIDKVCRDKLCQLNIPNDFNIDIGSFYSWGNQTLSGLTPIFDFDTLLYNELGICTPDSEGFCLVPINVSFNGGVVTLSDVEINYKPVPFIEINLTLKKGFNLINIPILDIILESLMNVTEITGIYYYNNEEQMYDALVRTNDGFIGDIDSADLDSGLFLKVSSDVNLTFTSYTAKDNSFYVNRGFNMINIDIGKPIPVSLFLENYSDILAVYKYDTISNRYQSAIKASNDEIIVSEDFLVGVPGEAYFVKADSDCVFSSRDSGEVGSVGCWHSGMFAQDVSSLPAMPETIIEKPVLIVNDELDITPNVETFVEAIPIVLVPTKEESNNNITFSINFSKGFNQINIPFKEVTLAYLRENVPDLIEAYTYNTVDQKYVLITENSIVNPTDGIFIKVNASSEALFSGLDAKDTVLNLSKGFNLVKLNETLSVTEYLNKNPNVAAVYRYDPVNQRYKTAIRAKGGIMLSDDDFKIGVLGEAYYVKYLG